MNATYDNQETIPADVLDGLQAVISDIDEFMFDWLQRFNRCAEEMQPTDTPDEQLRRRIREFQARQRQWESQQKMEQEQLEANATQLTDAWLRLEAEQRELLQAVSNPLVLVSDRNGERQSPDIARSECSQPQAKECQALESHLADRQGVESQGIDRLESRPVHKARVAKPRDVISPDAAIRQFEKLKNELSSSRKMPAGSSN